MSRDFNSNTKICSMCEQEFPRTSEYFYVHQRSPDGLDPRCKVCRRETKRDYARRNPEKALDGNRRRLERFHANQPDYAEEYNQEYYQVNRERIISRVTEYTRQHQEIKRVYHRRYYAANRDQLNARNLRNQRNDPIGVKVRSHRRRTRKMQNGGSSTRAELVELFEQQEHRCGFCGIPIFKSLKRDIHLEHMTPLVRGGTNDIDNLCYSCQDCNLSKGSKTVAEWQAARGW